MATNFAKNKIDVIGIDINDRTLKYLKNGKTPWFENSLQENIKEGSENISYTNSYDKVHTTDITVILVNTPSNADDGSFSNSYVEQALTSLCKNFVKNKKQNHHFILSSTVMPRSIKDIFIPLIEEITGWKLNDQFGFSYIPDFVAIGQIINDFENPDFLLIGSSNKKYCLESEMLYKKILKNKPTVCRLNLAEAELCKVFLECLCDNKNIFCKLFRYFIKKD